MKSAILLGFQLEPTQFIVFQIVNWKVRLASKVICGGPEPDFCDCPMWKFSAKCLHHKMVSTDLNVVAASRDHSAKTEEPINWKVMGPLGAIVVADQARDKIVVANTRIGNVGLKDLIFRFQSPGPHEICVHESLNPKRIYEECQTSLKGSKDIRGSDVIAAGAKVPAETAAPVDYYWLDGSLSDPWGAEVRAKVSDIVPTKPASGVEGLVRERMMVSATTPEWLKIEKPKSSDFYVSTDDWHQICYSIYHRENLLLTGPSGSGKSQVFYWASKAMKRHLEAINMGACSEPRTSLIGNVNLNAEGTYVSDSRFVAAFRGDKGEAVILLDELTRAVPGAFNILLPALDDQRYLSLDEHEDASVVHMSEKVSFCATANIGMQYTGTEALDKALKDRFGTIIEMFFPPAENEIQVLLGRCPGLSRRDATRLVKLATKQRDLTKVDEEFPEFVSTRMLIAAGMKIGRGMSFDLACKGSILTHFSSEGGNESDRTKMMQIIQRNGK
jgi:nitric oxide reductase NorQ protein